MPIRGRDTIAGLGAPVTYGQSVLVAGQVIEPAITGHNDATANVKLTRRLIGAAAGDLTYVFDAVAGTLQIDSANGADTGTIMWEVRG